MRTLPLAAGRTLAAAALAGLVAAAPAAADPGHATQNVNLAFAAVAGDQPVTCGTPIAGLGTTGQTAELQDLRFYVTDVALVRSDGKPVPVKLRSSAFQLRKPAGTVALVDLENGKGACSAEGTAAMNPNVRGTVPKGKYTGVRFTIGVPKALNHSDIVTAPAPLNLVGMGWSWQVGRKFLKVETANPNFMIHLGSTGCTGNPTEIKTISCTNINRPTVQLRSFDPSRQKIAMDIQALLSGSDLAASNPAGAMDGSGMPAMADDDMGGMGMEGSGCMSGPSEAGCAPIFNALGLAWKTGSGGGADSASQQKVFRAIDR